MSGLRTAGREAASGWRRIGAHFPTLVVHAHEARARIEFGERNVAQGGRVESANRFGPLSARSIALEGRRRVPGGRVFARELRRLLVREAAGSGEGENELGDAERRLFQSSKGPILRRSFLVLRPRGFMGT